MLFKKFIFIGILGMIIFIIIGTIIYVTKNPDLFKEGSKEKIIEEIISSLPEELKDEEALEGEVVDQLTTDLKGTGQIQSVALIAVSGDGVGFLIDGITRIYKDSDGKIIEWETPPVKGTTGTGSLIIIDNVATERKTIQAVWGCGAHGVCSQFVHWAGSKFEEIKAVDENGSPIPVRAFFSDAGGATIMPDGAIFVSMRNYYCPFTSDSVIIYKYEWNGSVYQLTEKEIPGCFLE